MEAATTRTERAMSRKKVLVLGGNFGGLTAAISVKHQLHGDVDVTVVSSSDEFLFTPSLIWVPFGKRTRADITFKVGPTFEEHEVDFVHAEATAIDPEARRVETTAGPQDYDYLVIATGYRNRFDVIPGLGEGGNAHTITTMDDAMRAGEGVAAASSRSPATSSSARPRAPAASGRRTSSSSTPAYQLKKAGLQGPRQAHLRQRRAVPRPLRHRRSPPRREAARDVPQEGGHRRRPRHRDGPRRRRPPRARRRARPRLRLRHDHPAVLRPGGHRPHRPRSPTTTGS